MNESNILNKNLLFLEICAAKKCITEKNIYAYRTYHYSDITDSSHPISPFIKIIFTLLKTGSIYSGYFLTVESEQAENNNVTVTLFFTTCK